MGRILLFLFKIRAFLLFLFLEAIAIGLVSSYNSQQGSAFFNSSNRVIGGILGVKNNVVEYFTLASVNRNLVEKNAELLAELEKYKHPADSIFIPLDSILANSFSFKGAKVINNSIRLSQNHITLTKVPIKVSKKVWVFLMRKV
jgi:rod shape-determining protein MreC